MIAHQQARRNLELGELIYANSMVAEEIAIENKKKQLSTLKQNQGNNRSVQMDKTESEEKSHTSPTHTREQVARLSGVGVGTVARYDAVMKSEDKILKDLIETNIRQRGIGNPNPVKLGRCIKELERIYGVRDGSAGQAEPKVSDGNVTSQSDIADMIGISVDTLSNYKKLAEMIPELEELI